MNGTHGRIDRQAEYFIGCRVDRVDLALVATLDQVGYDGITYFTWLG